MKKHIVSIILALFLINSCVKDDICIEPTTPNLIIRFHDISDTLKVKKVAKLSVWAIGKDTIYKAVELDSIILPLNLNGDETIYKMVSDTFTDSLTVSYNKKDVFVSRSCGFKTIFENVEVNILSTSWIKEFRLKKQTIENENSAHITILH